MRGMDELKSPGNILVLTYWNYRDALVQTYTIPYLRMIRRHQKPEALIYLLTLEKDHQFASTREGEIVKCQLLEEGIQWVPSKYTSFGISALLGWIPLIFKLIRVVRTQNIKVLHAFATPAGSAGYILSVLTGTPLVLDSFEPHAEAMIENGTWRRNSLAFQILLKLERWQARRASVVIATTTGMLQYAQNKYGFCPPHHFVKPACVDLNQFLKPAIKDSSMLNAWGWQDKIVCVYAGKLGGIYYDKEVFDFLKAGFEFWGDRLRFLFLTNQSRQEVMELCRVSDFDFSLIHMEFVPHAEVSKYLALADFALTPVKPVPTKRYCTPIKDGEYWAMGLPVVIPSQISDDSEIIDKERIGAVLKDSSKLSYNQAIRSIDRLLQIPKDELYAKIRQVAVKYRSYDIAEVVYGKLYGS